MFFFMKKPICIASTEHFSVACATRGLVPHHHTGSSAGFHPHRSLQRAFFIGLG